MGLFTFSEGLPGAANLGKRGMVLPARCWDRSSYSARASSAYSNRACTVDAKLLWMWGGRGSDVECVVAGNASGDDGDHNLDGDDNLDGGAGRCKLL